MIAAFRLYALMVVAAALFALAPFHVLFFKLAIFVDIAILIACVFDFAASTKPNLLIVSRKTSNRLSIGQANPIVLTIINQSKDHLIAKLKDDFPISFKSDVDQWTVNLPAQTKLTIAYEVTPKTRGNWQFGQTHLRYLSRLKLFWREVNGNNTQTIKVFSDLKMLKELSVKLSQSTELGEIKRRQRGQGTEFTSLKEYQVGDDVHFIDWKATARRHHPIVRVYDVEHEQHLVILVDAGRMMVSELNGLTRFDHALNSALALALTGLMKGDQVGLGLFADKPMCYQSPAKGRTRIKNMLELVFDAKPKAVEPDYSGCLTYFANQQKGRALIVLLTDLTDPTGSQTLLDALARLSPRHLPLCITLRDQAIDDLASRPVLSEDDIYRRVAALDLASARELALSTLNRKGCLTLDCSPENLTSRLIDQYLEIKTRGRL